MRLRAALSLVLALAACVVQPPRAQAALPDPSLPFVDEVQIGPPPPDSICARLPITVRLKGTLPNNCFYLKEVQVLDLQATPLPRPAIVRVVVGTNTCLERPCLQVLVPWSATVRIPGLPPGDAELPLQVQMVTVDCQGTVVSGDLFSARVPFHVGGPCPPPPAEGCFIADWDHFGRDRNFCDAIVGPGHPASVTLTISSAVALAGLQGVLTLGPPGLHIVALEAVGPAAGMHVVWRPTPDGARFAMVADQGAPIPAKPDDVLYDPLPVLKVTAAETPGTPIPLRTYVMAMDLLASNASGGSVYECPIRLLDPASVIARTAIICGGVPPACDFNHDGIADIRDLVLMIHCVLQSGYCPPDASGHLDCNQDGNVSIDDVLCCARSGLHGGTPGSPPGRPEPGVHVSFGVPARSPVGLDLPVRVSGADLLGALRLTLRFPSDRYEMLWIDGPSDAGSWLRLHDVDGSRLAIGLIGALPAGTSNTLDMVVHFALRPGQSPGGAMRIESGEFSGPDGAALEVRLDQPPLRLDGPTGLALSAGEPNPFAREARFTVTLTRPAEVELAVLDLGGRLVAVIHRGALGPGTYPFSWNGTRADGTAAPDGLYFYRARAGGEAATRKIILLRGR